jgi:hypothetical protein
MYVYMYTYITQMPFPQFPLHPPLVSKQSTYDNIMVANMVLEFKKNELKIVSHLIVLIM